MSDSNTPTPDAPAFLKDIESGKELKKSERKSIDASNSSVAQARTLYAINKGVKPTNAVAKPQEGLSPAAFQAYMQEKKAAQNKDKDGKENKDHKSFTESLDQDSLERFNEVCKRKFSDQAIFFLNAFWDEYGKYAEPIFSVHWDVIKQVDMHNKGLKYVHLYEEGKDLDFDMGLYFFEKLCKYNNDDKKGQEWKKAMPEAFPEMKTAMVRKKELRDTVDVNFDGRVSFLEYLLYQFNASPKTLMDRSVNINIPEEILKAQRALADVQAQINAYEKEKKRLEDLANGPPGVKALGAKNLLAQLNSSPLAEKLNKALITAEAAVRIASKKYGSGGTHAGAGKEKGGCRTDGSVWWLQRDLQEKQEKYGKKNKDEHKDK